MSAATDIRPEPGRCAVPVAVVMISLNEAHNMEGVLQDLKGWAQEVFLVDSYSGTAVNAIATLGLPLLRT